MARASAYFLLLNEAAVEAALPSVVYGFKAGTLPAGITVTASSLESGYGSDGELLWPEHNLLAPSNVISGGGTGWSGANGANGASNTPTTGTHTLTLGAATNSVWAKSPTVTTAIGEVLEASFTVWAPTGQEGKQITLTARNGLTEATAITITLTNTPTEVFVRHTCLTVQTSISFRVNGIATTGATSVYVRQPAFKKYKFFGARYIETTTNNNAGAGFGALVGCFSSGAVRGLKNKSGVDTVKIAVATNGLYAVTQKRILSAGAEETTDAVFYLASTAGLLTLPASTGDYLSELKVTGPIPFAWTELPEDNYPVQMRGEGKTGTLRLPITAWEKGKTVQVEVLSGASVIATNTAVIEKAPGVVTVGGVPAGTGYTYRLSRTDVAGVYFNGTKTFDVCDIVIGAGSSSMDNQFASLSWASSTYPVTAVEGVFVPKLKTYNSNARVVAVNKSKGGSVLMPVDGISEANTWYSDPNTPAALGAAYEAALTKYATWGTGPGAVMVASGGNDRNYAGSLAYAQAFGRIMQKAIDAGAAVVQQMLGKYTTTTSQPFDESQDAMRSDQSVWIDGVEVWQGAQIFDQTIYDNQHITPYDAAANRNAIAVANALGYTTEQYRGPYLLSAVKTGASEITALVKLRGGTDLTYSGSILGFALWDSAKTYNTRRRPTSIVKGTSNGDTVPLVLTFAAAVAAGEVLTHLYGIGLDVDPTGQLAATNTAVGGILKDNSTGTWPLEWSGGSAVIVEALATADFLGGTVPAGVTFSRSGSGTYVDASGVVQTAETNVARFEYSGGMLQGILLENAATNDVKYNRDLTNAVWTKTGCTATFGVEGATGAFSFGSELVVNGTFGSSTTGWTQYNATLNVVNGQLEVTSVDGAFYPQAYQNIPVEIGKNYVVYAELRKGTTPTNAQVSLSNAVGATQYFSTPNTTLTPYTFTFTAVSTTLKIDCKVNSVTASGTCYFDNISVKEIINGAASTITATANNAIVYQSITAAFAQRVTSARVRRRTGSGAVKMFDGSTVGDELVVNGGFDTDTVWSKGNSWSISGGVATHVSGSGTSNLTQSNILTSGKWYRATFTVVTTDGVVGVYFGSTYIGGAGTTGAKELIGLSNGTNFVFQVTAGTTASIDNASVKERSLVDLTLSSSFMRYVASSSASTNPFIGFLIETNTDAIDVDFVQCEVGSAATSDIATTSAAVTRPADVATISLGQVNDLLVQDRNGYLWNENIDLTPSTNIALWNRNLTNAVWTKTNCTAALGAVGIDGALVSTIAATSNNATVYQSITDASAQRVTSAYVRRKTGTGVVKMFDGSVTGNELVMNGSFDTDNGWTKYPNTTISGGVANLTGSGTGIEQSVPTIPGKAYLVTGTVSGNQSWCGVWSYPNMLVHNSAAMRFGNIAFVFVAIDSSSYIIFLRSVYGDCTVDNVSIKELSLTEINLSSSWQRFQLPAIALTNPIVGMLIATSGDAIDVDFVQVEPGTTVTYPIETTSAAVTRSGTTWNIKPRVGQRFITKLRNWAAGALTSAQKLLLGIKA